MSNDMNRKNRRCFKIFKRIIFVECAIVSLLTVQIISWMKNDDAKYDNIYFQQVTEEDNTKMDNNTTEIRTVEPADDAIDVVSASDEANNAFRVYSRNDVYDYESIVKRDDYEYPDYMEIMLEKYKQTIMFYNDYPEKKNNIAADNIGTLVKGEIPFMLQWDERWGYCEFGDSIIGCAGCGPTCLSMVIAGMKGDNTITPVVVGKYIEEMGYYTYGEGTAWSAMVEAANHFGIQAEEISNVRDYVYESLEEGHPIICSVGPGDFTTGGHFIVLAGIKDGKIIINDPNSIENSKKLWDLDEFNDQISSMWSYSLAE